MLTVTIIGLDIAEVGVSGARGWCKRSGGDSPSAEASCSVIVFCEAAAMPSWYRSLRFVASLVARRGSHLDRPFLGRAQSEHERRIPDRARL